jgi:hypothetical protein
MELQPTAPERDNLTLAIELVSTYREMLEQPLDENETAETRLLRAGKFYDENIANAGLDDELTRAFSTVWG